MKELIPLDQIFLLQLSNEGYNLEDFKEKKISILIRGMKLKGWLNDEGHITKAGKEVWDSMFLPEEEIELNKLQKHEDDFDKFWKKFPATDTVKTGSKILCRGSRSLKNDKDKCRIKFHQILSEGEYTAEEIIRALEYEVQLKIEKSLETRTNKMTYMKNSHAWLTQKAYEAFIEEAREAVLKPIKKQTNWDTVA